MSRRTRAVAVAVKACMLADGQRLAQARQLPVFRPEVVAPLADAVRFVDGDEADRRGRQPPDRRVARRRRPAARARGRAGGSDPRASPARTVAFWSGAHRAVVAGRRHAVGDERVHLILHQRDQRRHDERQAVADQRRRLEAQRLAAARRQHEQRVAAGDDRVHGFALQRTKRGVAPVLLENGPEGTSRTDTRRRRKSIFGSEAADCFSRNNRSACTARQATSTSIPGSPVPRARHHARARRSRALRQPGYSARPTLRAAAARAASAGRGRSRRCPTANPLHTRRRRASAFTRPATSWARRRFASRAGRRLGGRRRLQAGQRPDVPAVRGRPVRHLHHREHVRAADLSLGSDATRHRRDHGVVGRQRDARADVGPLLLHASARRSGCSRSWRGSPTGRCSCTA